MKRQTNIKLLFILVLSIVFITACNTRPEPPGPEPPPPPEYVDYIGFDNPGNPRDSGVTGGAVSNPPTNCGGFEEPCCEDYHLDLNDPFNPTGIVYDTPPCEYDLECRAGICVGGPDIQAFDRNNIY